MTDKVRSQLKNMLDIVRHAAELERLTITRDGAKITIVGNILTTADHKQLRDAVDEVLVHSPLFEEVSIDVAQAGYLDVDTLCTLKNVARKCVDVGMTLAITGANDDLLQLLKLTKMDELLGAYGARIQTRQPA